MDRPIDLIKLRQDYKKAFYRENGKKILLQTGKILPRLSDCPLKEIKNYLNEIRQTEERGYRISIDTIIKSTDAYKRLHEIYFSYINQDLSNFLKSQGITDSFDATIFYQYLLDLGVLSYPGTYQYDFDGFIKLYQTNEVLDTLGARIASGRAVCRHTSFQLMNLQEGIGNDVAVLNLITIPDFHQDYFDEYKEALYMVNHAINILFHGEGIYGYCSTTRSFFNIQKEEGSLLYLPVIHNRKWHIPYSMNLDTFTADSLFNREKKKEYIQKDFEKYHDITSTNTYNKELSELRFLSLLVDDVHIENTNTLSSKMIDKKQYEIAHQVVESLDEIKNFHKQTVPTLYRINKLYNSIAPVTNKKVKSLRIR